MKNDLTTQYLFPYTSEQVLGLAQHDYQVKTSRELAFVHKWQLLGHDERGVWGEIPVKDKTPIQAKVLLEPLSFSCSCVSYHSPCQHSLGLLLLWLEHPEAFAKGVSPTWTEKNELEVENEFTEDDTRRVRIEIGLAELELWLHDLVRSGLEAARTRPPTYYQQMADRLIDATLSEVAKDIRQLASINVKHPHWHEEYLSVLGKLHLMIQGFKRLDDLPETTAADLCMAVGWLPKLQAETFVDTWHVVGRRVEVEVNRKVQRTYLWSKKYSRPALLVDVLHSTKTASTRFLPGAVLEATLEFYTNSTPLRAEVHLLQKITRAEKAVQGETSINSAVTNFTKVKTANPWLRSYPLVLQDVVAEQHEGNWIIRDSEGYFLALPPRFAYGWYLRALSADKLWLFGEYDGERFLPISTWANGGLLELHTLKGLP